MKNEAEEYRLREIERHACGVFMSPNLEGTFFYSHGAAKEGRLVKVKIVKVGYTHVQCQHEDRREESHFSVGNCGKGGRNWEVIDLEFAEREIELFWKHQEAQKLAELEAIQAQHAFARKAINEAKQEAT